MHCPCAVLALQTWCPGRLQLPSHTNDCSIFILVNLGHFRVEERKASDVIARAPHACAQMLSVPLQRDRSSLAAFDGWRHVDCLSPRDPGTELTSLRLSLATQSRGKVSCRVLRQVCFTRAKSQYCNAVMSMLARTRSVDLH